MGSIGSRQGEMKVMIPSKKEIRYCIDVPPLVFILGYQKYPGTSVM
jgi:hypothetical protein